MCRRRCGSVLSFALVIPLICCNGVARRVPINYILLFAFTIVEGFLVATSASYYNAESVALAVGMTAVITVSLTVFAFQVCAPDNQPWDANYTTTAPSRWWCCCFCP